jgi:hypothetical protein
MKFTGYDDPVRTARPNLFKACDPPQWYKDNAEWMELDSVESYMRSLEWYVGRLTNQELTQYLRMAVDLDKRNDRDFGNGRLEIEIKGGDEEFFLTCEPTILIPLIRKEMAYRKGVDAARAKADVA